MQPYVKSIIQEPFTKTPDQVLKLLLMEMIDRNQELVKKVKGVEEKLKHAVDYLHRTYCNPCAICDKWNVDQDQKYCEVCDRHFCIDCIDYIECEECEEYVCRPCMESVSCEVCERYFCTYCLDNKKCEECGEDVCRSCMENGRCNFCIE